jgi:hypothetical protein
MFTKWYTSTQCKLPGTVLVCRPNLDLHILLVGKKLSTSDSTEVDNTSVVDPDLVGSETFWPIGSELILSDTNPKPDWTIFTETTRYVLL